MKKILAVFVTLAIFSAAFAQETIYLWPEKIAPGSKNVKVEHEIDERSSNPEVHHDRVEMGITEPYMTLFKAENPNGAAVLIIPGGAYQRVVYDVEGADRAKLYNENGYTVFVLNYRLPGDGHEAPLGGDRAHHVREHSALLRGGGQLPLFRGLAFCAARRGLLGL